MISQSPEVNALHKSFCEVSGQELPMLPSFERQWLEAHLSGVTPDMVATVWKKRLQGVRLGERREASTYLRAFCGSEEAIGTVVEEYAAIMAKARIRVVDSARASVLRATHRVEPTGTDKPAQSATDVIERLKTGYTEVRKAIGE